MIHLWLEESRRQNGESVRRARIDPMGKPEGVPPEMWFSTSAEYDDWITPRADPFVLALVFHLMLKGRDLHVHGEVSRSLLANLEEFIACWTSWKPKKYKPITISADKEADDAISWRSKPALSAFSGGVDACFTAYRHKKGLAGRSSLPVEYGLMVHGDDIPLNDRDGFNKAYANSSTLLEDIGLTAIYVRTNAREFCGNWKDAHGAVLAGCLTFFQRKFGHGLIGSSEPYSRMVFPHGMNPVSDPLLSNNQFRIVHDGAAFTRTEKVRALCDWPMTRERLRVCWHGPVKSANCGICDKCVRTILNFRVNGVRGLSCMPHDASDALIRSLRLVSPVSLQELEMIVDSAKRANSTGSWIGALKATIRRNRWQLRLRRLFA